MSNRPRCASATQGFKLLFYPASLWLSVLALTYSARIIAVTAGGSAHVEQPEPRPAGPAGVLAYVRKGERCIEAMEQLNVLFRRVPRAGRSVVGVAVGHRGGRETCPCEGVGAAQCVGQPVLAGHVPDQARRVGAGHSRGGDEQRAHRGSA